MSSIPFHQIHPLVSKFTLIYHHSLSSSRHQFTSSLASSSASNCVVMDEIHFLLLRSPLIALWCYYYCFLKHPLSSRTHFVRVVSSCHALLNHRRPMFCSPHLIIVHHCLNLLNTSSISFSLLLFFLYVCHFAWCSKMFSLAHLLPTTSTSALPIESIALLVHYSRACLLTWYIGNWVGSS